MTSSDAAVGKYGRDDVALDRQHPGDRDIERLPPRIPKKPWAAEKITLSSSKFKKSPPLSTNLGLKMKDNMGPILSLAWNALMMSDFFFYYELNYYNY